MVYSKKKTIRKKSNRSKRLRRRTRTKRGENIIFH